jgi:DNA (cytosine-5)-methyltransferase 1
VSRGLVVDLFAGGGGASVGIEAALGRAVDVAINHDATALAVHKANHPETRHLEADIWEVRPQEATGGRPVDLLWASPDCTHFSIAKGDVPRRQEIRSLAWAVVRWAAAVRPAVIILENVSEFRSWGPLGKDGRPVKNRMGATFLRWRAKLQKLSYVVDLAVLNARDYGAPTARKRLFIVARRDGLQIRWPAPTHGPGLLPYRTAAECIDWSLPCPSIFERKRPLAEKTQWRIAQGIRRFVLENPRPFIVQMSHGQWAKDGTPRRGRPAHGIDETLGTVTASNDFGVVAPVLATIDQRGAGARANTDPQAPLPTTVTKNRHALVAPVLAATGGPERAGRPRGIDTPAATVLPRDKRILVAPSLVKVNHGKREARAASVQEPLATVTATQRGDALVLPTLMQIGYGERDGQAARVPGLEKPLGTVVAGGGKHALVGAFLAKHFGGVVGQELEQPASTITAKDHHALVSAVMVEPGQRHGRGTRDAEEPLSTVVAKDRHAIAAASLVKLRGECHGADVEEPAPTITAGGTHVAEVRAFLTAFYGEGSVGQRADAPLRTVTAKHRLGLVTVEGTEYQIVDIGMRMLEPHELLRAQFGRFAEAYDLGAARTKAGMVRLIGNSVCPEVAEAVVRANVVDQEQEATA